MGFSEEIAVFVVCATLVLTYGGAAGTLLSISLERFGLRDASTCRERRVRTASLAAAGIATLILCYARWVEPYWPRVVAVELRSRKLPAGHPGVRLVHISDLHSDPTVRLEKRLPRIVAEQDPDVIVFTGDAVNSDDAILVFKTCMKELSALASVFAVRGNWDVMHYSSERLYEGTSAIHLRNRAKVLNIHGTSILLAGLDVGSEQVLPKLVETSSEREFSILLYHYPGEIYAAANRVDLYLAGHTHGGQIALPFYGALVTLARFGKRFEAGLYRVGKTWLYVNSGIGMEGGLIPRMRFWARPEVTVITIAPEDIDAET